MLQKRRIKADCTSEVHHVVHPVGLTVGPNVWRCPLADALHVHVPLQLAKFLLVLPNQEVGDDLVSRDLNADSDWWLQAEELHVLAIEVPKLTHIIYVQTRLNDTPQLATFLKRLQNR